MFDYGLFEETPIYVTGYETCRSYLFPSSEGVNYAVIISYADLPVADLEYFDDILHAVSNLIFNAGDSQ